jgi:tRNA A-37 threonylcarbamoyl transferase component Bud32
MAAEPVALYFVNWQRRVSVEERGGQKVVVKRIKPSTAFNEFVLLSTYMMISLLLAHPSLSPSGETWRSEGQEMRQMLARLGVPTPKLISISRGELVEEYVEGGDLYRALAHWGADPNLAFDAGALTGRLHGGGYVFTDNKAQNYLVRGKALLRTDLGFLQKNSSTFARSMDAGSFLASVIDLAGYRDIESGFYRGYRSQTGRNLPYLSLVIRNILAAGFSSDSRTAVRNMMLSSSRFLGA